MRLLSESQTYDLKYWGAVNMLHGRGGFLGWVIAFFIGCSPHVYAGALEQYSGPFNFAANDDLPNDLLAGGQLKNTEACSNDRSFNDTQEYLYDYSMLKPQSCVGRCTSRWSNGECRDYGSDYCSVNPICVPRCVQRFNNGQCQNYGADSCGQKPLSCIKKCSERFNTGDCKAYGPDYCGANPQCSPSCTARWPDGACRTYGTDACDG